MLISQKLAFPVLALITIIVVSNASNFALSSYHALRQEVGSVVIFEIILQSYFKQELK